ncbi:MAG: Ig-like domain-containing protein [Fibrobacteres bacterium]|nr:Ig-like domain-containing protein [Fibrobacterota bacterium]
MKNIIQILTLALVTIISVGCGRTDNEVAPAASTASFSSYDDIDGSVTATLVRSGLLWDRRNSGTVPIQSDSAILLIAFPKTMSKSASVTLKRVNDNQDIPVTVTWDVGSNYSTLKINPTSNLQNKRRYWLKIAASSIIDSRGNKWDNDGDKVGGETIDDDVTFYFTTVDTGNLVGVPTDIEMYVADEWEPALLGSLYCWVNGTGQTPTTNTYVNSVYYLRVTDRNIKADRSNMDTIGPYLGTFSSTHYRLVDGETNRTIPAAITLVDDPDTSYKINNSTVRIQPDSNLMPNKTYYVVVQQNLISDVTGNKMGTDDGPGGDTVMFRITTDDSLSGGTVVGKDVDGPVVVSYITKRIKFDELVDTTTINNSTIWYKDAGNVERPLLLTLSVEYDNTGKPVSVVTVTPDAGYPTGTLYINLRKIKDRLGNYGLGATPTSRTL